MRRWFPNAHVGLTRAVALDGRGALPNAFDTSKDSAAHPLLYHVPTIAARTVGRESEVMALWQHMLAGRRLQALTGVDGIGKSTIVAELCECVRRSHRFTCVHWLNGEQVQTTQLANFFQSMKDRRETRVLLVLDDVPDARQAISLLPHNAHMYAVLTTADETLSNADGVHVTQVKPLAPPTANEFVTTLEVTPTVNAVFSSLGYVPLLMHIATLIMEGEVMSPADMLQILTTKEVRKAEQLSISHALQVLLDISIAQLEQTYPAAREVLAQLACFHLNSISETVVAGVRREEAADFAAVASQLGIFSFNWEANYFPVHPAVGRVLRQNIQPVHLEAAAECLRDLWPRRWRGLGSSTAYNLVWHTVIMSRHFRNCDVPLSPAMMTCMDRSATHLAHSEGKDMNIAAELWWDVYQHDRKAHIQTVEAVRIARECGRLLHYMRDDRAEDVLRHAYKLSSTVYGARSAERALIMGCLAPYLSASEDSMNELKTCVSVLEGSLASVDTVWSKEETRMMYETVFVLLVRQGQMLEEMGCTVPDSLWASLERVGTRRKAYCSKGR